MCWTGLEALPCFRPGLGSCSYLCPSCGLFLGRAATQEQSLFCGEPCAPVPHHSTTGWDSHVDGCSLWVVEVLLLCIGTSTVWGPDT